MPHSRSVHSCLYLRFCPPALNLCHSTFPKLTVCSYMYMFPSKPASLFPLIISPQYDCLRYLFHYAPLHSAGSVISSFVLVGFDLLCIGSYAWVGGSRITAVTFFEWIYPVFGSTRVSLACLRSSPSPREQLEYQELNRPLPFGSLD